MFEDLACVCDACDSELGEDRLRLTFTAAGGERRAYECQCGAVTVAVSRTETTP